MYAFVLPGFIFFVVFRWNAGRYESEETDARISAGNVGEAGCFDDGGQILHRVMHLAMDQERKGQARQEAATWPLHVHDQQTSTRFEHTPDFSEPEFLQVVGQVMHHQAAEHDVKGATGEGQRLYGGYTEVDAELRPVRFRAGNVNHLGGRIDATHQPGRSGARVSAQGEFTGAAADLEHGLARLDSGQVGGLLTHGRGA